MPANTDRVVAAGTKLFGKVNAEGGYTQMAAVVSLGGPEMSADQMDVTELDPYEGSTIPANPEFWKRFMAGWRDGGQVTMTFNFTQAAFVRIRLMFARGTMGGFYFELRSGLQIPFNAFVSALGQTQEKDNLVQCPVTFKIDGAVGITTPIP